MKNLWFLKTFQCFGNCWSCFLRHLGVVVGLGYHQDLIFCVILGLSSSKMATKIVKLKLHGLTCENPRGFEGSETGGNPRKWAVTTQMAEGGSRGNPLSLSCLNLKGFKDNI